MPEDFDRGSAKDLGHESVEDVDREFAEDVELAADEGREFPEDVEPELEEVPGLEVDPASDGGGVASDRFLTDFEFPG